MNSLTNPERDINSHESCYVLLWSQSQSAMHIELLEEMLERNRRNYLANRSNDYQPIVFGSLEQCRACADKMRPTVHKRQLSALERNSNYDQGAR